MSPFLSRYKKVKASLPKTSLLLMRLGDFYEAFEEDAKIIAKELQITLTKRGEIPMCGIPYHAIEPWTKKLIKAGYTVARVEPNAMPTK